MEKRNEYRLTVNAKNFNDHEKAYVKIALIKNISAYVRGVHNSIEGTW